MEIKNRIIQNESQLPDSVWEKLLTKKVLFVIPAFNEAANISRTIQMIRKLQMFADILVIDDGSDDDTFQKACNENVLAIALPFNLGIGGAVQTGFQYANKYHYDLVIRIDADGQHDPEYVRNIIEPIIDDEADFTIGSRFLPPFTGYRSSFIRRIGIQFFALLISFLTKNQTTDPTSGFTAYNKKMINIFSHCYPQDFPEPEAIMIAQKYQARVKEVAVKMHKRTYGSSSIRYIKTLYYMIKVTFAILLVKLKKKTIPNA